jgi:hypothetical protein
MPFNCERHTIADMSSLSFNGFSALTCVRDCLCRKAEERLLLTRLAAVASPVSLGYALVQSDETDTWYHGIVSALVGQSTVNKGATLKT